MPSTAVARPILLAAAGSHAGLQRENNEDRYHCDPQRGVFMVIDGVGGHAAGEKAAETALTMIRARLERETGGAAERIREAITLANNEIFRLAGTEPSWRGMACVLTVALVREGRVTIGHVGDTRLYAFTGGRLAKITHDHSPIGEREDRGDLGELEAMRHPRRNEIYRDVGSQHHEPGDADFIETIEQPFGRDSALLLCTDGLSDLVPSARLARIVAEHASDPNRVVDRLIEAANAAGGKDNVTAVYAAGPGFPEAARRQLAAGPGTGVQEPTDRTPLADRVRALVTSRPAMLAYGLLGGLALAAALLLSTQSVPNRLLEVSRPVAWQRTWQVGAQPDADFATIAAALERAQPGDLVEVDAGSYDLPIVVPKGVHLVASRPGEAVLRAPDRLAADTPALSVSGDSRVAGFKIDATGLATGVLVQDDQANLEDLEIVGTSTAAVMFGPRSRGALRASYLHDNAASAVIVDPQALPRLLHNVITGNGRPAAPVATPAAPASRPRTSARAAAVPRGTPAVVLQAGATAVFFGNIIVGNGEDQVEGLAADRRADVVRDNVIGLQPAAPAPQRRR